MVKLLKGKPSHEAADSSGKQDRISEAAYYLAEKRGFEPGGEVADWLLAEDSINAN